jgi:hypothetical protein
MERPSTKGRELWFHLRIGAAIATGYRWLAFTCPACRQIGEIDLRTLDQHLAATIESLIPALSCRRCRPNPPFVKLLGSASCRPIGEIRSLLIPLGCARIGAEM